jgi:hypothetical protein
VYFVNGAQAATVAGADSVADGEAVVGSGAEGDGDEGEGDEGDGDEGDGDEGEGDEGEAGSDGPAVGGADEFVNTRTKSTSIRDAD